MMKKINKYLIIIIIIRQVLTIMIKNIIIIQLITITILTILIIIPIIIVIMVVVDKIGTTMHTTGQMNQRWCNLSGVIRNKHLKIRDPLLSRESLINDYIIIYLYKYIHYIRAYLLILCFVR